MREHDALCSDGMPVNPGSNETADIPATWSDIERTAHQSASDYRARAKLYHSTIAPAWLQFTDQMIPSSDGWHFTQQALEGLGDSSEQASQLLNDRGLADLREQLEQVEPGNYDNSLLRLFLLHDFYHIEPSHLFNLFPFLESSRDRQTGSIRILDRHKQFLDQTVGRSQKYAALMALPLEFIEGIAQIRQKKEPLSQSFGPADLFHDIATIVKGRFILADFGIEQNGLVDDEASLNRISISVDPDLRLTANQAMIFSPFYNLTKNAAKAYIEKLKKKVPLYAAYGKGETEISDPCKIQLALQVGEKHVFITVSDNGDGLSLDRGLRKFHDEYMIRLDTFGRENLHKSEWYWNIRRAIGDEQAEILFAWPTDDRSIRGVNVGSIWDCAFVSGFDGDLQSIRSFTSGMGLWGVRYLTEILGGSVMVTNKFTGGADFTIALPKDRVIQS